MKWHVSYVYLRPYGVGPFSGSGVIECAEKPRRGEIVAAMMGLAEIKTVSKASPEREVPHVS